MSTLSFGANPMTICRSCFFLAVCQNRFRALLELAHWSGTGDRESVWSVNTEKEYHEEAKEQKQ